jgi:hypothetical protein
MICISTVLQHHTAMAASLTSFFAIDTAVDRVGACRHTAGKGANAIAALSARSAHSTVNMLLCIAIK